MKPTSRPMGGATWPATAAARPAQTAARASLPDPETAPAARKSRPVPAVPRQAAHDTKVADRRAAGVGADGGHAVGIATAEPVSQSVRITDPAAMAPGESVRYSHSGHWHSGQPADHFRHRLSGGQLHRQARGTRRRITAGAYSAGAHDLFQRQAPDGNRAG